jgi:RNA polymerase sigma-B factor
MSGQRTATPAGRTGYEHLIPLQIEFARLSADDPRRAELRDELVTGYLPVARHIARRYAGRGEPKEDLEQVATVGLIHAVDRFEPARGVDFLGFAVPTVVGEVRRHFRDRAWSVRVPRRLKDLRITLSVAIDELSGSTGTAPTIDELAEHVQLPKAEVSEALTAANAYQTRSLDAMLVEDPDSGELSTMVGTTDAGLERAEHRHTLDPLMRKLPERERTVLVLRYCGNLTQAQIATQVGISQMSVSRLLTKSLARLRADLAEKHVPVDSPERTFRASFR